ncbi:MAG: hypothetical protein ACOYXT_05830 [Bacteroidota bacterium]
MRWRIVLIMMVFIALTIVTQIGGVVLLFSLLLYPFINKKFYQRWKRFLFKSGAFIILYLISTFIIVPIVAKSFGRVPLPVMETNGIQPLNVGTCLLNRHYVRPAMKSAVINTIKTVQQQFPEAKLNYLDANFPFIDRFPLFPHLSHNDGKKLDLAFFYRDKLTGNPTGRHPSFIGYGICEEPQHDEEDAAAGCEAKGYWQYSLLKKIVPQSQKKNFVLDTERTKFLVEQLVRQESVGKVFIEPHLKKRMHLASNKIRFHGCQAVRHDDHIHVQLK